MRTQPHYPTELRTQWSTGTLPPLVPFYIFKRDKKHHLQLRQVPGGKVVVHEANEGWGCHERGIGVS